MYIDIEKHHMVDAEVDITLPQPEWMDKEGKIVCEMESYGMIVETKLTHPHCCLVMDETGGDNNMMNDATTRGQTFVGRKGQYVKTTIGLTGLDGNPVM